MQNVNECKQICSFVQSIRRVIVAVGCLHGPYSSVALARNILLGQPNRLPTNSFAVPWKFFANFRPKMVAHSANTFYLSWEQRSSRGERSHVLVNRGFEICSWEHARQTHRRKIPGSHLCGCSPTEKNEMKIKFKFHVWSSEMGLTSQLKLRVAACFTNGTISVITAVCVVRKLALLSESWLSIPTVWPMELHPGHVLSLLPLLFTSSSIFVSRKVCVHRIGHGPCASQKWHNAIIAFI